ncbi:hypothetical protein SAMN03159496_04585 [Rhizobium sp. NFR07]|uniref:hypothetical protein n=1 Tax=Rhizobium sp. NFR07 TaxID=1566262 RepID=UPI0008E55DF9|nr:hypothetical protein [Rhizobium sp. NFR07]SFB51996.1 hypothetical protein SAMN03159496_04585 [Rhizobium sp. NFR07]
MSMRPLIEFLEREIELNTAVAKGIEEKGDKWSHDDGTGLKDVTDVTLADAKRKIAEATEHLDRLRS